MVDDQIRVGFQSEGGPNYHYHTPVGFLITVLWVTIQTKYEGRKESPFETYPFASVTVIVVVSLYALTLMMAEIIITLPITCTSCAAIFSHISLIFGSLASVLLLYIVVPIVGWIAFFVWLILMAMVAWKIYQEHHQLLKDTTSRITNIFKRTSS